MISGPTSLKCVYYILKWRIVKSRYFDKIENEIQHN